MMNAHKIKLEICDIGRRIYNKGFAAANDGNISVRINDNEVLCTPTLHCKGFLKPEDICTVDMSGQAQIAGQQEAVERGLAAPGDHTKPGRRSRASCIAIRRTPRRSPMAREPIPQCILPEVEVFLGDVPIAKLRDARRPGVRRDDPAVCQRRPT
jgi:L-fuculose-phosphate aldolase